MESGSRRLFHTRPCGHGVGPHLDGFLGLLGRLRGVLTLIQGLLHDTGGLARRDSLAAFQGPGAGAAGRQQRKCEPGQQEGMQVVGGGSAPLLPAFRLPARSRHFTPRDLGRAGQGSRRRSIGRVAGPQQANVLALLASSPPPFDYGLGCFG